MPKKLTHEYVETKFTEAGCQLISTYIDSRIAVEYICPKGHRKKIQWCKFNDGQRCKECVCPPWLPIDDSILRSLLGQYPLDLVVKIFNREMIINGRIQRSRKAIRSRIQILGISYRLEENFYTCNQLAKKLGVSRNLIAYWTKHKGLPYHRYGNELTVKYIKHAEFAKWLKSHKWYMSEFSTEDLKWIFDCEEDF